MEYTTGQRLFFPPTVWRQTWSRCETGVNQACYCTAHCDLGQRIMMVPQPKKRPEAIVANSFQFAPNHYTQPKRR